MVYESLEVSQPKDHNEPVASFPRFGSKRVNTGSDSNIFSHLLNTVGHLDFLVSKRPWRLFEIADQWL